jgi:hypothetical protein
MPEHVALCAPALGYFALLICAWRLWVRSRHVDKRAEILEMEEQDLEDAWSEIEKLGHLSVRMAERSRSMMIRSRAAKPRMPRVLN